MRLDNERFWLRERTNWYNYVATCADVVRYFSAGVSYGFSPTFVI